MPVTGEAPAAEGVQPASTSTAVPDLTVAKPLTVGDMGTPEGIGRILYDPARPWLFPFEVTSILLLIAVVGSVVLAKRRLPGEGGEAVEEGNL